MSLHSNGLVLIALAALGGCSFPDVTFGTGGNGARSATAATNASGSGGMATASTSGISSTSEEATGTGGATSVPGVPVNLGNAGNYVVLDESGITNVPPSIIKGDLGVSPIAIGSITGFVLTPDGTNTFSTSPQVNGKVYAASHAAPTPEKLMGAVADMQAAFSDAATRTSDFTELGAGVIGGLTIAPGVYNWTSTVSIASGVTLKGNATDVWIFQIAQTLKMSGASHMTLTGGALAKNVFWQVSGLVDVGAASHFEGIVLGQTSIAVHAGASITGRLLAQTGVTFEACTVAEPPP
jgi:Ice-binding-like